MDFGGVLVELGSNQISLDFYDEVKSLIQKLTVLNLKMNFDFMELGLTGEIGFCKFLERNGIKFTHQTLQEPERMHEDIIVFNHKSEAITIDVKTTQIRPHHAPRILSIEQFHSIPSHSEIIVWCHFSSRHSIITIDGWTKTSELNESNLKQVTAPPDYVVSHEELMEQPFTEKIFVYEVPSFLMREVDDLLYLFKGVNL